MDQLIIHGFGCTDIGHYRDTNEDSYALTDNLFVVADGMGGHNAGDIASTLAVDSILELFEFLYTDSFSSAMDYEHIQQGITDAILKANETIYQESQEYKEFEGMGTTIVLAWFQQPNIMHIANVGDSRAYLYRKQTLEQLTQDHSVTAMLLDNGTITEHEAQNHPYRHHLSQSIGNSETIQPYTTYLTVEPDDIVLLCSDGLWNSLSQNEIISILKDYSDPQDCCPKLIAAALDKQSMDNITCIIIKIQSNQTP